MYKDILLPVDLNDEGSWRAALPTAIEYARAFDARLHVMTVVPEFGMSIVGSFFPANFEKEARRKTKAALDAFCRENVPRELDVQHIVAQGTIYREIIATAESIRANLIVMAAHRPDLEDYLLGPNAARVVRHSRCSVLVVRE